MHFDALNWHIFLWDLAHIITLIMIGVSACVRAREHMQFAHNISLALRFRIKFILLLICTTDKIKKNIFDTWILNNTSERAVERRMNYRELVSRHESDICECNLFVFHMIFLFFALRNYPTKWYKRMDFESRWLIKFHLVLLPTWWLWKQRREEKKMFKKWYHPYSFASIAFIEMKIYIDRIYGSKSNGKMQKKTQTHTQRNKENVMLRQSARAEANTREWEMKYICVRLQLAQECSLSSARLHATTTK